MTSQTENYSLTKLDPGESVHAGTGAFPSGDRDLIDRLLHQAINHHHTGGVAEADPETAPVLTLVPTGGTLPASTTVRYCYTYSDPATGETGTSPVAEITTPDAVASPTAPTFTLQSIGGSLVPGQYFYVLTAYDDATTIETKALNPVSVAVPAGTTTNEVTLQFPALPVGADGFNVYRRAPGETKYYFLSAETGTDFVDGGVAATTRTIPSENTTNAGSSVQVDIPGATPAIPAGSTWTIYRSYTTSFVASRLVNLDELTLTYLDVGDGTSSGSPPTVGVGTQPSKVDLASEVQGLLPFANTGFVVDEDDMVSDSAVLVPTQQSVKAFLAASLTALGKADVGLANVDNTSDVDKPVSTEQQTALDLKVDKSPGWELNGQAVDKTLGVYTADAETTAFATTLTNPADAPVDADALREDLVANSFPQLRQAMTDLNNLRVAYENLRLAHEDLRGIVAALVTALDTGL